MNTKAPFGWTVVAKGGDPNNIVVYKRDRPNDQWSQDLVPFTHATRAAAIAAGKRGDFAYKR